MPFLASGSPEASVLVLAFPFALDFGFSAFLGVLLGFRRFGAEIVAAIELYLKFFVEAIRLLPSLKLVARLLGFFFVCAKIEQHIGVGHRESLRCDSAASQDGPALADATWAVFLVFRNR